MGVFGSNFEGGDPTGTGMWRHKEDKLGEPTRVVVSGAGLEAGGLVYHFALPNLGKCLTNGIGVRNPW